MAAISPTTFSNAFSRMKSFVFWLSLKFVPKGLINNIIVQVIDWYRSGDKPLCEPMLTQFNNAYMRHQGEMG